MRTSNYPLALGIFACLASASLQAAVLNVDFQGGGVPVAKTGLAAAPDAEGATATWNLVGTGGSSSLNYSDGAAATGITISLANPVGNALGAWRRQNTTASTDSLLYDYVYENNVSPNNSDFNLTIGGITAGSYDLYIYAGIQFGDGTNGVVNGTVNGGTAQTANFFGSGAGSPTSITSFEQGGNYVLFSGISPDLSGNFVVNLNATTGEATLNGIQLVPIPEPGSIALLALGSLALLRHRRV